MKKLVTFAMAAGAALVLTACGATEEAAPAEETATEEMAPADDAAATEADAAAMSGNPVGGNPVGPSTPEAPAEGDAMAGEAPPAE